VDPGNNTTVCDLSASDYAAIIWTIKNAFVQAFGPTLAQFTKVFAECI